ncbi:MAG: hypothetical protein OIN89_07095 [Candidatus Methanoperedens sp.]|nr:hypothetical protein [Candidatus Methanoperedens sp.]
MREVILRQKQEKEQILKTAFVPREVSKNIEKYIQSDIIKVVTGIRRCGKSVKRSLQKPRTMTKS